MEIKFLNLSIKDKNKYLIKNLNCQIKSQKITGIYQDTKEIILKTLLQNINYEGEILIDSKNIISYNDNLITEVLPLTENTFLTRKVKDEFFLIKRKVSTQQEDYILKIISSLNLVGLDESYLEKDIYTLSKSEKRLLQIALALVINPDILILVEPFAYLDRNNFLKIENILFSLKRKYKKTIIIYSQDINILHQITDNLIIFHENKILISDKTDLIFNDLEFLKKNHLNLPEIISFIDRAYLYKQKLHYTKNINDLIKEVYRNVQETKKDT